MTGWIFLAALAVGAALADPLPAGWSSADVGAPTLAGSATYTAATGFLTLNGAGTDIWNTADQFRFASQPWTGDAVVIARVESLVNTHSWAKAGVMIRESLAAGSRYVMVALTPGNGVAFLRRTATNGTSLNTSVLGVTLPNWVKIERLGNRFDGYYSTDGLVWKFIGSETIAMTAGTYTGAAVCSHNTATLTTAVFSRLNFQTTAKPAGLWGEYFNGKAAFTTPVLKRLDSTVNFTWGAASPAAGVPADAFTVRWTGSVVPDVTQSYTFYTQSDDGVRLWVNGQLLVDNWTDHGLTENSGTLSLVAGTAYSVKMEYYDNAGGATAALLWSAADRAKAAIPSAYLVPAQYPDADNDGLPDWWETLHGLNPASAADAALVDPHGTGATYLQEYQAQANVGSLMTIVSGDQQSALVSTFNAKPLDVALWKSDGSGPLVNTPVTFTVTSGGGLLAATSTAQAPFPASLVINTDQDGTAEAYYRQPATAGVSSTITATATGTAGVTFNSKSLALTTDSDGNGLPDWWEYQYFGKLGNDPSANPSGDGMSNLYKAAMGLNPLINEGSNDKDGDGIPNSQDARPNDSAAGRLTLTITSPLAGAVFQ